MSCIKLVVKVQPTLLAEMQCDLSVNLAGYTDIGGELFMHEHYLC